MGKLRTHYDNLQVSETASQEVVRGAYKYLSQKWHPDRNPDDPEKAARIMKIINDAYDVLSDPQKRREHNEWIRAQREKGADAGPDQTGAPDADSGAQEEHFQEPGGDEADATASTGATSFETHPWRRYFARLIDILSASFVFGAASVFFDSPSGESPAFLEAAYENNFLLSVIMFFFWMPIEALCLSLLATTPGKWILGISVLKQSGEKLSFPDSLKRSLGVWVQGLAFGIPFVSLFTVYNGYKRLTTTGTTLWDDNADSVVWYRPLSRSPVIYVGVGLGVFAGIAFVRSVSNQSAPSGGLATPDPIPSPAPAPPTPVTPVTPANSDFGFYIENKCRHAISILIRYQDINGVWKTDGRWKIGGYEEGYLNDTNGKKITTNSAIWYYHAETTDGSNLEWRGEHSYAFQGKTYDMIKLEDKDGDSNWSTTCN